MFGEIKIENWQRFGCFIFLISFKPFAIYQRCKIILIDPHFPVTFKRTKPTNVQEKANQTVPS